MKFPPLVSLLAASSTALLSAAEIPKAPERHVRFLAVGEMPPFRQEIHDGVRYELEPPEGSIPPREVMLGFGEEKAETTTLRLGQISGPLKVPEGAGPLTLRRAIDQKDSAPWLQLTRPEDDDFLVLLWRASAKGTWNEAKFFVLPDGPITAPAGSVRVVNLAPVEVKIVFGNENLILGAGKSFQRLMHANAELPFQILMTDVSGTLRTLHSGDILQNQGERSLVLVYRADGESPRRPVKVTVQREPAAVLPVVRK
ncbi:MAG: hypothetical protein ABI162_04020 [Luteolibacter sp.]